MKGQISIETLMILAVSIGILSLLLIQVKTIEKIAEKTIQLKEIKKTNETINSLCKTTAVTNSKQEIKLSIFKKFKLIINNKYCLKKQIYLKKGKNNLTFYPGSQINLAVT